MTMPPIAKPRAASMPYPRDVRRSSVFVRLSKRTRGLLEMVHQSIEKGVNTTVITLLTGLIMAGIIAVVSLQWSNSIAIAQIGQSLADVKSDVGELKKGFADDRNARRFPQQPNR